MIRTSSSGAFVRIAFWCITAVALIEVVSMRLCYAQDSLPSAQHIIQSPSVQLVPIETSVLDKQGDFVGGLTQADFHVLDNGVEQPIGFFAPVEAPAQVLVMLETSPAVYLIRDQHLAAAYALLQGLAQNDEVALVTYDQTPQIVLPFTSDKSALLGRLNSAQYVIGMGDLNLYDSISAVLDWLAPMAGKREVVLLTTGLDSSPAGRWEALVERLRREDVVIFSVALGGALRGGPNKKSKPKKSGSSEELNAAGISQAQSADAFAKGDEALRSLTAMTGGRAYFPKSDQDFAPMYREIASALRHQYVLGISPAHDNQFHSLTVEVVSTQPDPAQPRHADYRVLPAADIWLRGRDSYIVVARFSNLGGHTGVDRRRAGLTAASLFLFGSLVAHKSLAARASERAAQDAPGAAQFHLGGNVAEIPARFVDNLVFLPAAVNRGQPSLFELDSTAPTSTIDPSRASDLGISDFQSPVLNMSGVDVQLPGLGQAAKKDFGARVGREYEGTLGKDFFDGAVIEINYSRQTVRVYDPASYQNSARVKPIHLTFNAGVPVVRAKISLGGKEAEGEFAINTALDASLVLSPKFAEAHKLRPHKPIPSAELGSESAVLGRVSEFEMGGFTVAQFIAVFPQGNSKLELNPRLAGEIGGGMLRRFVATFDYPHHQLILEGSSDFRADEFEDMSGLVISASGPALKKFEVVQVWPHTPGADAGIQKGDVIEGVNDEAAADMSLPEIRALFRQPGGKYKILLQRNSKTVTVNLKLRRLLMY